jgi:hypothetical protein
MRIGSTNFTKTLFCHKYVVSQKQTYRSSSPLRQQQSFPVKNPANVTITQIWQKDQASHIFAKVQARHIKEKQQQL